MGLVTSISRKKCQILVDPIPIVINHPRTFHIRELQPLFSKNLSDTITMTIEDEYCSFNTAEHKHYIPLERVRNCSYEHDLLQFYVANEWGSKCYKIGKKPLRFLTLRGKEIAESINNAIETLKCLLKREGLSPESFRRLILILLETSYEEVGFFFFFIYSSDKL
jgi:hypothetical protein